MAGICGTFCQNGGDYRCNLFLPSFHLAGLALVRTIADTIYCASTAHPSPEFPCRLALAKPPTWVGPCPRTFSRVLCWPICSSKQFPTVPHQAASSAGTGAPPSTPPQGPALHTRTPTTISTRPHSNPPRRCVPPISVPVTVAGLTASHAGAPLISVLTAVMTELCRQPHSGQPQAPASSHQSQPSYSMRGHTAYTRGIPGAPLAQGLCYWTPYHLYKATALRLGDIIDTPNT